MNPVDLIGMKYRLGACPAKHGAADCLSLARAVLAFQGIETPTPSRHWYRRLRRGDTNVFPEELARWGIKTTDLELGVVALCQADLGFGLASYWESGLICFRLNQVVWSPLNSLEIVGWYLPKDPLSLCMP